MTDPQPVTLVRNVASALSEEDMQRIFAAVRDGVRTGLEQQPVRVESLTRKVAGGVWLGLMVFGFFSALLWFVGGVLAAGAR